MGGLAGANAVPVMYEVHEFAIAVLDLGQFRDDEPQQSATPGATYSAGLSQVSPLKSRNSAQSRSVV